VGFGPKSWRKNMSSIVLAVLGSNHFPSFGILAWFLSPCSGVE
jgi:hypothetical protein